MSDKEFAKFDTHSNTGYHFVRLAKDAQVKNFGDNNLVSLTFVDDSRVESDEPMWVEANPNKGSQPICSFLEKGDIIGFKSGKLTFRRYGDAKDKVAFNLRNAEPVIPPDLIATLKERGFVPGSGELKGSEPPPKVKGKPGRPPGKGKAAPVAVKTKVKAVPIEIDLDEDEAEEEE